MQRKKVFISSVQSEFAAERQMLFKYLTSDVLLGKFFEPFVFENMPAIAVTPTMVFLQEIEHCDIYIGLFGEKYGFEDAEGISPTEREYDYASIQNKIRYIFIKNTPQNRHPKEKALIQKAEQQIVRKSFDTQEELKTSVYATLVRYLEENEFIRTTPFDATLDKNTSIADLDEERIRDFIEIANRKRAFPFSRDENLTKVLSHLNLIKDERITNAALLLFGKNRNVFLSLPR